MSQKSDYAKAFRDDQKSIRLLRETRRLECMAYVLLWQRKPFSRRQDDSKNPPHPVASRTEKRCS